ncbi:MAG: agmatinase [Oscillospiraceae bacterium]|nr:agmatinase [Oscillospiraceae bacterium]
MDFSTGRFIAADTPFDEADTVLFGAPYDSTTSFRPGTRFGPSAIRSESFGIETYSPYQDKDLCDARLWDMGDLELPFGAPEPALKMIEECTEHILSKGKLPIMTGGEHLVTLGAFRAVQKRHKDICLIQFDAHTDLRQDYLGNPLSHACVIRRCHDIIGDGRIWQFGIRSGEREEFAFAGEHTHIFPTAAEGVSFDGVKDAVREIGDRPVYLTIDLDVLDPSCFCGTGTPEAGGCTFNQLLVAVMTIGKELNVVAADLNELSPHYDQSGASTALACKLLREVVLCIGG